MFESSGRRLFIPDGKDVAVIDADTGTRIGVIRKIGHVSDMAFAPEMNQGFAVDSDHGVLTIIDLYGLTILERAHAGSELSLVLYDPSTKKVFAASDHNKQCQVFDPVTRKVIKTVKLGGYAFRGFTGAAGHAYFELSSDAFQKSIIPGLDAVVSEMPHRSVEIAELDMHTLAITNYWKAPCKAMILLGVDSHLKRLVGGCNGSVVSIDDETGRSATLSAIAVKSTWFVQYDSQVGNAVGFTLHAPVLTLIVLPENTAGEFVDPPVAVQEYRQHRHHIALDGEKGQIFVLISDEKMVPSGLMLGLPSGQQPLELPEPVPGTFRVEVYGKN